MPKNRRGALAVAFGFALALALLEVCCRVGVIPNTRFEAGRRSKAAGRPFKVLILGDSFIEERGGLDLQLQAYFAARGAVCLNLARGGMRPLDYLRMLQSYGPDFSPDLILLNYTLANDLSDSQLRTGRGELRRWLSYRPPPARSYLWEAAADALTQWVGRRQFKDVARAIREDGLTGADIAVNPYLVQAAQTHPDFMLNNLALYSPPALRAWDVNKTIILKIRELGRAGNSRLLINVFPAAAQVDHSHDAFFEKVGFVLSRDFTAERIPQDYFAEFCRRQELSCNDLLPGFRRRRGEALYSEDDDHWNDAGKALAFRLITGRLEALKLIPGKPGA